MRANMRRNFSLLAAAILFVYILPTAGLTTEAELKQAFEGKIFLLRNFYRGKKLTYNVTGEVENGTPGIWTIDGHIKVNRVRVRGEKALIEGERLTSVEDPKEDKLNLASYKAKVEIEIPLTADSKQTFARVFVNATDTPETVLPEYWREWARTHEVPNLPPQKDRPPSPETKRG